MSSSPAPLVTIVFLAYQQIQWVRASAEACLAQRGGPYEILLSDDHSTDGTFEALQAVAAAYRGPHQVSVRQSATNLGIGQHYNDLVRLARGELLVTMAADDFSTPDRVERLLAAWESTGRRADLVASHVLDMDPQGQLHGVLRVDDLGQWTSLAQWAEKRPYIIGATHAFTRRLMEQVGPLDPQVFYEDQIMVFRAIAMGGAVTVDAPLVHYRRGGTSMKPAFESPEALLRWTQRQRRRELAEMRQLLADAQILGCVPLVQRHIGTKLARMAYLHALGESTTDAQRWQLVREHRDAPFWWRLRKALHGIYPQQTQALKQGHRTLRNLFKTSAGSR
ncbi:glycosyltransferase family 2 protein [Sphaerotilus sp.]|jgi:glycosyltransferase involved in cell wall biosynthesis|uniref:glycosyltransferase family 2 protein n=1 Tax=Sphaerotilus sp. TaxID=2093942 RepID=UPI0025FCF676|nr:glycosyltransferase [Sphaerotilus sp.]